MSGKPFYITTTLPYVNADPHIGFALELVQADAVARAKRLEGREVFFSTGTDEHGQKIYEKAVAEGRDVREYVDFFAKRFDGLKAALDISNDAFIRTTDEKHVAAAQEMWRRCDAAGDIYKKDFEGIYCVGCESFKTERDLVEGKCPLHPNLTPERVKEENYFFRFSKYADRLREYLTAGSAFPEARRNDAIQFVDEGLEDFSISRRKERMSWGIPVPGDDDHVMYVWFDALTNYISTLDWPSFAEATEGKPGLFQKFWVDGETMQTAGKDQVRFQSLMWQAMLMSANLPTTQRIAYHGFVTAGGQKMSKSLGNVVNPFDLVDEFGTDAVRYFFLRHLHPFEDGDYTRERFVEAYNAGLANGLGNLVSRVMKMAEQYLDAAVDVAKVLPSKEGDTLAGFFALIDAFELNKACDMVWDKIAECDALIQETQPFKLVKDDPEKGKAVIADLAVRVYTIGRMLNPLMPATSKLVKDAVKANKKPENLFGRREG